jgi:hypothetical protein
MNRISQKYKNIEGEITTISHRVIEQMEDNLNFPDPPAALANLKKILPEFQQALADAGSRDRLLVSIKNDKKKMVLALLQELVDYVTVISKGDRTHILGSGFEVTDENGSSNKQPPSIKKLEVEASEPGVAITRIRHVTNAIAFIHQYTTEPPGLQTIWVSEGTSLGSYTFRGLHSDKRHWFRVVAIGYHGLRSYSPIVSWVIQ